MHKLVVLFSGNGSNMENLYHCLMPHKISFELAITNNPNAYGIQRCKNLGIQCEVVNHKNFATRNDFDSKLTEMILTLDPDLVVLAGFMRILGQDFVKTFKTINIHPSFLPNHKGSNAIEDSYKSKYGGGVSVHWVNEKLDDGEIILQEKLDAGEQTIESFSQKVHLLEYKLYPQAILKALKI